MGGGGEEIIVAWAKELQRAVFLQAVQNVTIAHNVICPCRDSNPKATECKLELLPFETCICVVLYPHVQPRHSWGF
jgi:hypothetical protein